MATPTKKKQRIFTLAHRQRLDRAAEHYLRFCYRNKKAARASEFALYVGRTPEYLSWLTKHAVGKSLRDFLREKQLAFAAQLLRTTPLSHKEIAARAAFGSRRTLYRLFWERFGMTPGAYQELKK